MSARTRNVLALLLPIAVLAAATGCGGNVTVGKGGAGGAPSGGDGGATAGECAPTSGGEAVNVCFPMDGDFCPPGDWGTVLEQAAGKLGVCAETGGGVCCGQPAVSAVLCDLPPGTDSCCYVVEEHESGPCAG